MSGVTIWNRTGNVHSAAAKSLPAEPRYMRRAQVMATLDYPTLEA